MRCNGHMSAPEPTAEDRPPTCPNCVRLQAQLQTLHERVAALEAELRRGKRKETPFSREKSKEPQKRPGRKPGKGRFHFQQPPPEEALTETIPVPLPQCSACGGALTQRREHEHFQVDLPKVHFGLPPWERTGGKSNHCRCVSTPRCARTSSKVTSICQRRTK